MMRSNCCKLEDHDILNIIIKLNPKQEQLDSLLKTLIDTGDITDKQRKLALEYYKKS
jgi:hypothetical protein